MFKAFENSNKKFRSANYRISTSEHKKSYRIQNYLSVVNNQKTQQI